MPLGQQFNPARPTDGDLVRSATRPQLATVIRELRAALKTFFSRRLDPESGELKAASVPSSSLRSIVPDPTGTYRSVTVNRKGQVTAGSAERAVSFARPHRAVFFGQADLESWVDGDSGRSVSVGTVVTSPWPGSSFSRSGYTSVPTTLTFLEHLFTVPNGVDRVDCVLSGGTPYGQFTDAVVSRRCTFQVSPGDVLRVYVGSDQVSPCRVASFDRSVYMDSTNAQSWSGAVYATRVGSADAYLPGYGGSSGSPAVVIIEWYA